MLSPVVKVLLVLAVVIAALPLFGLTGVGVFWLLGVIALRLYAWFGVVESDSSE